MKINLLLLIIHGAAGLNFNLTPSTLLLLLTQFLYMFICIRPVSVLTHIILLFISAIVIRLFHIVILYTVNVNFKKDKNSVAQ